MSLFHGVLTELEDPYDRDGILSVGDFPFPILLPEPLISTNFKRIYCGASQEIYDPTA